MQAMDWYWHYGISYMIVAVGAVVLALASFLSKYRGASLWLRSGLFLIGPVGIAWSALGLYLLRHQKDGRTLLSWPQFWALDHMKSNLSGLAVGMLLCLMLSPEFRSFLRRKPKASHQPPQPTADRPGV
jgi:uncharacterized membrane protein